MLYSIPYSCYSLIPHLFIARYLGCFHFFPIANNGCMHICLTACVRVCCEMELVACKECFIFNLQLLPNCTPKLCVHLHSHQLCEILILTSSFIWNFNFTQYNGFEVSHFVLHFSIHFETMYVFNFICLIVVPLLRISNTYPLLIFYCIVYHFPIDLQEICKPIFKNKSHFKMYNSVSFCIFTELYSHHHYLILDHFTHHPPRKTHTH